ncbi:globin [Schlesneria sp. T3-172]|uniref:globin domain-containing protein n=1 Tax=Schlesneria sphaerica TaxID=3373610 RepID=UPI0037C8B3F4
MPDENAISSVYNLIGETGFERLVAAFYRRVPGDDILGPMYPAHDLAGAEHRLKGFLIFRFGGPDRYLQERGHPQLRMRHAPFAIDEAARHRWVKLMDEALVEAELPEAATTVIRDFLHDVATFLINRGPKPNMIN